MLFQPTNVYPSTFSGIESQTIDATQDLTVSWQVNGNSPMVAYQIDFYQNNAASTLLLSTGKVALGTPFYGVNNLGVVQFFSANPISASTLAASSIYNGFSDGYKYVITQWWSATDSLSQTSANAFITRTAPSYSINSFPNPLSVKEYTFSATYIQAQGDALNWVRWYIAQGADTTNLLYDSGDIYGTADLSISYDGFFSGENYLIRSEIQTESGASASTGWQAFSVNYTTKTYSGFLTAAQSKNHSGVLLTISGATSIPGTAVGAYVVSDGSVALSNGANITWNSVNDTPMSFLAPNAIIWKGTLTSVGGTPWTVSFGTMGLSLSISNNLIRVIQGNNDIYSAPYTGDASGVWTAILNPGYFYIQVNKSGNITNWQGAANVYQVGIVSAIISGEQSCNYFWINEGALSSTEISQILSDSAFEPSWNSQSNLLALFESDINAGNLSFSGYSIYREEVGTNAQSHVVDISLNIAAIIDFGAKSQSTYIYRAFSTGSGEFLSNPLVSNQITPVFWSPTIVGTETDENGIEIVETENRFSANVETAEMSNNNAPNMLENFTPYPLRQPKNSNYRSGSLTAMLGTANSTTNAYVDTDAEYDALLALSTTQNNLYLKTRKGAIYNVVTAGAIKAKVGDQYIEQPYTVTVPWAEIGSMDGVSIVAQQYGALWPVDNITQTSAYVDPQTGNLYWTVPSIYADGSILSLNTIGDLLQTYEETFTPAEMVIDENGNLYATT